MKYVYLSPREPGDPYTVGFYDPHGNWHPESDHATRYDAAQRVAYLNGFNPSISQALNEGDGSYRP